MGTSSEKVKNDYHLVMRALTSELETELKKDNPNVTDFSRLSFVQVPLAIVFDPTITHAERTLYCQIQTYFCRWGHAYPSQETLAKHNGKVRETMCRLISQVEKKGMIKKVKNSANHTGYLPVSPKGYYPWLEGQDLHNPAYYLMGYFAEHVAKKNDMQKEWDEVLKKVGAMPKEEKLQLVKDVEDNDSKSLTPLPCDENVTTPSCNAEDLTPPLVTKTSQGVVTKTSHNTIETFIGEKKKGGPSQSDEPSPTNLGKNRNEGLAEKKMTESKTEIKAEKSEKAENPQEKEENPRAPRPRKFPNAQQVLGTSEKAVSSYQENPKRDNGQGLLDHFKEEMRVHRNRNMSALKDPDGRIRKQLKASAGHVGKGAGDHAEYEALRELMTWTIKNFDKIKESPDCFWKIKKARKVDILFFYPEISQRLMIMMQESNQSVEEKEDLKGVSTRSFRTDNNPKRKVG